MTQTAEQLKQQAEQLCQSPRVTNEHVDALNEAASKLSILDAALAVELSDK